MNKFGLLFVFIFVNLLFADISKNMAMNIAQEEIGFILECGSKTEWNDYSIVTDAFPLYLDGIDGVSYYECKVKTNDSDAGYILVNVNKTDIPIVQAKCTGKTITEEYQASLNRSDMKIYRYDWIRSAASRNMYSRSNTTSSDILGSIGFSSNMSISRNIDTGFVNTIDQLRQLNLKENCFPLYTRSELDKYYESMQYIDVSEINYDQQRANSNIRGEWDSDDIFLDHTIGGIGATPSWYQANITKGGKQVKAGCGPLAWAMSYAYLHKFHNRKGLFYQEDLGWTSSGVMNYRVIDCIESLYDKMEASSGDGWTYVPSRDMPAGINYAKDLGYSNSYCNRIRDNEYDKFVEIYEHIKNYDVPVILRMELDKDETNGIDNGRSDHYVVIEGAHKSKYKYFSWGGWYDRHVRYLVNMGWGDMDRLWLYTRHKFKDKDGVTVHNAYSAFLFEVKGDVKMPSFNPALVNFMMN